MQAVFHFCTLKMQEQGTSPNPQNKSAVTVKKFSLYSFKHLCFKKLMWFISDQGKRW